MKIVIAITDCRTPAICLERLSLLGFRVITLPPCKNLSEAVCSHTDMLLLPLGNELISTAEYSESADATLTELWDMIKGCGKRMKFTSDTLLSTYPNDCKLNALVVGDKIYLRTESASEYVKSAALSLGLTVVGVKQGYPACTVLKLNDRACITADRGMAKALRGRGVDVTLIDKGHIDLPPHEYGFIGGCAGVYGGCVYFVGDPKEHPSYELIRAACDKEGLRIVPLGVGRLRDVGGIIFTEGEI